MSVTRDPAPNGVLSAAVCEVNLIHPETIARVRATLPSVAVMQRVAAIFQTLADPTRARIVVALATEELCVCDVAVIVGLSVSAASHQLKRLRDQGVVSFRKEGRLAFYQLRDPQIRQLVAEGVAHVQRGAGG